MDLTEHFGKEVRRIRLSLNISQEDLAIMSGVNRSYMGQIERGLKSASLQTIECIAHALHCSPSQLVNFRSGRSE
jgi:transcriptional regulator with XRE-family HTH domain